MRIYVETVSGSQNFGINVEPYYSIRDIKRLIELLTRIPATHQALAFRRTALQDESTLSDYDIQEHQSIFMAIHSPCSMQVTIETSSGIKFTLGMEPYYTVRDVRLLVLALKNMSTWGTKIYFLNTILKDSLILAQAGIQDKSTLCISDGVLLNEGYSTLQD